MPLSWPGSSEIVRCKNSINSESVSGASSSSGQCKTYVENSKVSESLLLMKFYCLSAGTVNHLLSDVEGKFADLPFEVTDEERDIILYDGSSFILGRSGTGKTTILTMKLHQKFQQYCIASRDSVEQDHGGSESPVLHQLFVTVSPKLCHAVKKTVSQMKRCVHPAPCYALVDFSHGKLVIRILLKVLKEVYSFFRGITNF